MRMKMVDRIVAVLMSVRLGRLGRVLVAVMSVAMSMEMRVPHSFVNMAMGVSFPDDQGDPEGHGQGSGDQRP